MLEFASHVLATTARSASSRMCPLQSCRLSMTMVRGFWPKLRVKRDVETRRSDSFGLRNLRCRPTTTLRVTTTSFGHNSVPVLHKSPAISGADGRKAAPCSNGLSRRCRQLSLHISKWLSPRVRALQDGIRRAPRP